MAVRSPKQRVLVADRNPATRDWFRKVLGGAGCEVLAARNTEEALVKSDVDLVIVELAESAEVIRQMQAKHPRIKIAATARSLDPATLRAADLLGAQAVMTMPLVSGQV